MRSDFKEVTVNNKPLNYSATPSGQKNSKTFQEGSGGLQNFRNKGG